MFNGGRGEHGPGAIHHDRAAAAGSYVNAKESDIEPLWEAISNLLREPRAFTTDRR
jgi:hypothetical protein